MQLGNYFDGQGPGTALGVVPDAGEGLKECYGVADLQSSAPIGPETAFDLASVTKVFTATTVLLLCERGRLRMNDPISRHLPRLTDPPNHRPVTVQDLLWHTSDIPDYLAAVGPEELLTLTSEAVLQQVREWMPQVRPGRKHEYSNTNYFLLAETVSSVAGASYADFLHRELFEPFALSNTFVLGRRPEAAMRARGYQNVGFGSANYQLAELDLSILGDGGVFSSLADLIRWQKLYFSGLVLSPASLAHAVSPGRLDCGTTFDYGCGLLVETLPDGRTWCGHTGGWNGASAYLGRIVEERVSVIVLSNEQLAPVVRIAQHALGEWRETCRN